MHPPHKITDIYLQPLSFPSQRTYTEALLNKLTHKNLNPLESTSPSINSGFVLEQLITEGHSDTKFFEVLLQGYVQRVIGLIAINIGYPLPDSAHIQMIVLDEKYRSKGLGSLALRALEDNFHRIFDIHKISLQVVPILPNVVNFWKKNGYLQQGKIIEAINPRSKQRILGITLTKNLPVDFC